MSNEITEGVAEPSTETTASQSNMSAADFVKYVSSGFCKPPLGATN
jgi:hypothetical protein